jgi:undecaprenyl-diphosphatase
MVDPELITDGVLHAVWSEVDTMHSARIAHRHLSPANVLLDESDRPWLIDFGFAEISARDGDLNGDVAQLMATLALRVGAPRAVATAVHELGPAAVAAAAPRLQPTALSTTTRNALKKQKGLLDELQTEVAAATGLEEFELERLERVRSGTIFTTVMLGFAFYFLIPQLAEVDFGEVAGAEWKWFTLVVFFSLLTYAGAAMALMGAMPERLHFMRCWHKWPRPSSIGLPPPRLVVSPPISGTCRRAASTPRLPSPVLGSTTSPEWSSMCCC